MKRLLFFMLMHGAIMAATDVNAQTCPSCPTGWTQSSTTFTLPGTSCAVSVCYCEKGTLTDDSIWITEVDPSGCSGIDYLTIVSQAQMYIMQAVINPPNCNEGPAKRAHVFRSFCWELAPTTPANSATRLLSCNGISYSAYCEYSCSICYDAQHNLVEFDCLWTIYPNDESNPYCSVTPPIGSWIEGQCYLLHCGGGN
jgi:hypothetical protein